MTIPWMDKPLDGDLAGFLREVEDRLESGQLSIAGYHVALGKAMGYVEARFSDGRIDDVAELKLLHDIERMIQ